MLLILMHLFSIVSMYLMTYLIPINEQIFYYTYICIISISETAPTICMKFSLQKSSGAIE